jgi:hypothetical protein
MDALSGAVTDAVQTEEPAVEQDAGQAGDGQE